ncbi:MAG: trigger factor [Candidatus Contendobacter odensis]|uniref:Trigger factor n=1 Tax=Candidatus Contendibacter odensensis TaxID=1400860 RepID=A0A2G6PGN1_9GAMM|nr:MAG: trigger factor [Candidatus Contendobacter odensis]
MQVSVETLNNLERRVTVQVPAEKVAKEIQDRLLTLARRAKVDGFRPGKAPLKIIRQMYGNQVHYETITELMEHSLRDALTQENLNPLGGPKIEPKTTEEGQDLEYTATFEVMPEFELTGFDTIKVERLVAEITEQDIDEMIENLRQQKASWHKIQQPAGNNNQVHLDFEGKIDGQSFENGSAKNIAIVLGEGRMIEGFEDHLIGARAGDNLEFDVTFPDDYPDKNLATQTAHYHVKLHAVEEKHLPEVNDAFCESFDVKEGGLDGLRSLLRENMERELTDGIKADIKRQVMQSLLAANDIPIPQTLIAQEVEQLAQQMRFPATDNDQTRQLKAQLFEPKAKQRVALGLLISQLAKTQEIKADENRVQERINLIASTYQDPGEVLHWYAQTPQALDHVRALVLEEQVVEWLLGQAQVTEKPSTFSEVMAPEKPPVAPSEKPATQDASETTQESTE